MEVKCSKHRFNRGICVIKVKSTMRPELWTMHRSYSILLLFIMICIYFLDLFKYLVIEILVVVVF